MTVIETRLPTNSILSTSNKKYDYADSFQSTLIDKGNKINSADVGKAFFTSGPEWVGKLLGLREKLVSIFGLETSGKISDRQNQIKNFKCEPGEQLGLFKVFMKSDNEVVIGTNDKHLNFRISLFLSQTDDKEERKDITISTVVEFNNWFGRLYFLPVKPFHKIIVPSMLKGIIKELEKVKVY